MKFMGAKDDYNTSNIVVVGVPMDHTGSYRPGTRQGPAKIREVSYALEEFSFYQQKDLKEAMFFDSGDIELPFGNVERTLNIIEGCVSKLLKDRKTPVFLGGEHLITLPIVKKFAQNYSDLIVIQLDAHADLRKDYLGEKYSHACVIRNITEYVNPKNIYQFGIRSGTREETSFGKTNTNFFPFEVIEPVKKNYEAFKNKPIYLTIDIDIVDPGFAPGTGTPEPGGITSKELIETILLLGKLNIVGMDLVEVLPAVDISDKTAVLAALIIREMILSLVSE